MKKEIDPKAVSVRLIQRMKDLDISGADITRATGASSAAITKWRQGINAPTRYILPLSRLLQCTPEWLLHGEEPRNISAQRAAAPLPTTEDAMPDEPPPLVIIPEQQHVARLDEEHPPIKTHRRLIGYDVRLSAGSGNAEWVVRADDNDRLYFRNGWFKARHLDESNLRAMYVSGDSMTPYLYNKDTVIVDITDTEIIDGEVYAILFKGKFYVKELRNFEDGVKIISYNPKYEMMKATPENCKSELDFRVLGKVIWRGG